MEGKPEGWDMERKLGGIWKENQAGYGKKTRRGPKAQSQGDGAKGLKGLWKIAKFRRATNW